LVVGRKDGVKGKKNRVNEPSTMSEGEEFPERREEQLVEV
jgi:hypothetical protein